VKRAISILLLLIFALSLSLTNVNLTKSKNLIPSTTTFYDFVANADKAVWQSSAGTLPFPGSTSDSRGFALWRLNYSMEDNLAYSKVLETHPEWKDKTGYIKGTYPEITVPQGAKLELKIGFLKGATATDGVNFKVFFDMGQPTTIFDRNKKYTGTLDTASIDLSNYQGKKGKFILYVSVYATSSQDWACWVDAKVTTQGSPDLVITDLWVDSNKYVHYKIKNIGDAQSSSQTTSIANTLYFNNSVKASDTIAKILYPGEEYESYFKNYLYPTPQVSEILRVCADTSNNIKESNEQNNCREETITPAFGGIKVDTGCPKATVVIANSKTITGVSDDSGVYSSGLTLTPGKYKIVPSKASCTFDPPYQVVDVIANKTTSVTFKCSCVKDTTPPKITKGPDVSKITQTSVVLIWETDEESDSKVHYGNKFKKLDLTKEDKILTKNHSITLSNLLPATVYVFIVESKDSYGNSVQSKEKLFETLPEEDKEKPTISLILPEKLSGIARIKANVNDNKGVDRVVFSMDGKAMFTDFSPPYEWNLDTGKILDGSHSFKASVFDFAGNIAEELKLGSTRNLMPPEETPIKITINEPASWSSVYGYVPIEAAINSDIGSCISRAEIWINETLVEPTYDFHCLGPIFTPEGGWYSGPSSETINYNWNTIGLPTKNYVIEIKAWDDIGNYGHRSIVVSKIQEPDVVVPLSISRRVTRTLNYFEVELNIRNGGLSSPDYTLYNFIVVDKSNGFQAVYEAGLSISRDAIGYNVVLKNLGTLTPGETKTLSYKLVPIIYDPLRSFSLYWIGQRELNVSYNDRFDRSYSYNYSSPSYSSSIEVQNALASADYLIVTSPDALYRAYDTGEVDTLLSATAELAKEKLGVLGYLPSGSSAEHFKNLISATGAGGSSRWFGYLQDNWVHDGYMLILGEENIIPMLNFDLDITVLGDEPEDFLYADTCSADEIPELKLGRIIGNTAANLTIPLRSSISIFKGESGHYYNPVNALLVSGVDSNPDLQAQMHDISRLASMYIPGASVLHWSDYTTYTERNSEFKRRLTSTVRGFIYYQGHGGPDSWCNGLDCWSTSLCPFEPLSLGGSHPVVYATACSTGRYWDRHLYGADHESIAGEFLRKGAGAYIGIGWGLGFAHFGYGEQFINLYSSNLIWTIGQVFRELQRTMSEQISVDHAWRSVIHRYRLFGDPKFGER
jgi:hypothetical protein